MLHAARAPHPAPPAGRRIPLDQVEAMLDAGRVAEATPILADALKRDSRSGFALYLMARACHLGGEHARVPELLRSAAACGNARVRAKAAALAGDLLRNAARAAEAAAAYDSALAAWRAGTADSRTAVSALRGLARIDIAGGRFADAIPRLRSAYELDPDHPEVTLHLAWTLGRLGLHAELPALARRLLALPPRDGSMLSDVAVALAAMGETALAEQAFAAAAAQAPANAAIRANWGLLLLGAGRRDEAAGHLRAAVSLDPAHAMAHHLLGALAGDAPPRASDDYVRTLFDDFAPRFDDALVGTLAYRAPDLIADLLDRHMPGADGLAVLDAGCGTGLCAAALRPRAASLTGVDLSPRMLERARGRALYDALEEAELTTFLLAHPAQFDVIAAADVLVYFGELAELFAAARGALRPHGRFAFTVERHEPAPDGSASPAQPGYELQPSGRYRHGETYLRATAAASGFAVDELQRVDLRLEQGVPVGGFLVLLTAAG